MGLASYIRSRVRFQRVSDAKIFSGWLQGVFGLEIAVECEDPGDCCADQEFYVQALGPSLCAVVNAKVKLLSGRHLMMEIKPPVRFVPATEDARRRVDGVTIVLTVAEEPFEATVADTSKNGIGILSPVSIDKDSEVAFELTTRGGSVVGKAQVRYCREDRAVAGLFRVGLHLSDLDRLAKARWTRILSDLAA